ncbi:hypothetical protein [Geothrix sp.]|jgi:hypothetical protein|uniref:hypothetical protein n=1 Tax=Geothrix sp. TaxID=1962974 RepID=UPI0025C048C9|nr:hypothetical protein [Geothrix sp.]
MGIRLSLDMSIDREAFRRLLPGAVGAAPMREEGDTFCGAEGRRRWRIQVTPLAERRLGSLALPRHRVEIQLEGYLEDEAEAFLARFHRGFQRGGG